MNRQDPKGYYKALGVPSTASSEAIKSAFRALAMSCHPDKNPDEGAVAQFKKLSEAYAVLSDPRNRATYDGRPYDGPDQRARPRDFTGKAKQPEQPWSGARKAKPNETIHCTSCGRPTAQPREAVYWTVVSVLIATWRTASRGVFCAACASKVALRCTAISAATGWWGPLGLFWTPISIYSNATGGRREAGADASLLWHNARAFMAQGKPAMAHALARKVAASKSVNSLDAADLLSELHRSGVPRDTPPLVDPWKQRRVNVALQTVMGLAAPAIVAGAIYVNGPPTVALASAAYASALAPIMPASTAAGLSQLKPRPRPVAAAAPAMARCGHIPDDGYIIDGHVDDGDFGHQLEIANGADGPAIVKLRDAASGRVRVSFFVSEGGHARVGPLPDGAYRIQYAIGPALAEDCRTLTRIDTASEFPVVETLRKENHEEGVITQRLSYTLNATPSSKLGLQAIDPSKFLSE